MGGGIGGGVDPMIGSPRSSSEGPDLGALCVNAISQLLKKSKEYYKQKSFIWGGLNKNYFYSFSW